MVVGISFNMNIFFNLGRMVFARLAIYEGSFSPAILISRWIIDNRLENRKKETTRSISNIAVVAVILLIFFLSNSSTRGFSRYAIKNDNIMGIKTILKV